MTRLRSCDACSRHVFVTETRCPFCQAALRPPSSAPIFNIKPGMSRTQRFALVAAVASQALIGCSDEPKGAGTGQGSGGATQGSGGQGAAGSAGLGSGGATPIAGKGGGVQPVYGAPFEPGGGGGGSAGAGSGGGGGIGGAQAVYGAPVPTDAGTDTSDAGDQPDAGVQPVKRDGGGIQPVYGAPVYGAPIYGAPIPQGDDG